MVVLWTTPAVRAVGLRSSQLDVPNERKVHTQPMVRLGGVSIFTGVTTALLLVWGLGWFGTLPPDKEYEVWGVTIGSVLMFLVGLADDLFSLPALPRLAAQGAIAWAAWTVGVQIEAVSLPGLGVWQLGVLSLPLTLLWLVGVTNAINFIDGLDGLAAGISGIAACVTLIVALLTQQWAAALIAAALAGAALGFLRYNFNPAQIFMGDGGAYFLGFMLAGLSVIGVVKLVTTAAIVVPLLILSVPILDTASVIIQRLSKGQSPFKPDKRHLHHQLLKVGLSHRFTVLTMYALTLWAGCLALALTGLPAGWTYTAGATILLSYVAWSVWRKSCEK
ncbi:glycosyltransferase family 4 protein [Anthocerotibacter panamensis]|uniref:glycosyltransferase family 4 protein n=1 Tax=Anthocerotibacter panamensis TaxID=2857077 RepID=UPI0036F1F0BA